MAAVVVASPASQAVSQYVDVTGTGGGDDKNRLKLDGVVVWAGCADTSFEATIQLGAVAGTSVIDWEQYIAGTWTSVDTFSETVTASGGGTATPFPGTGPSTAAALAAMMSNTTIRRIEIAAGTYAAFHGVLKNVQRGAGASLLVTTAPGAAVTFTGGAGTGQTPWFNFNADAGPGTPVVVTDYITIDGTANGGTITLDGYSLGSFGLLYTGWVDHIAMNNIIVTNFDGVDNGSGQYNQSHSVYTKTGSGHAGTNITTSGWNVTGTSRHVNGLQKFGEPQGAGHIAHSWVVTGLHRWALIYGTSGSGVDIDGWSGTSCDATIDSPTGQTISGSVKNSNGHGSCGTLALGSGPWTNTNLTDGGGNTA